MLKNFMHILIATLLLAGSSGLTISKHYCGNTLHSIRLDSKADKCCNLPIDCCHDETITIKIDNDFSLTSNTVDFNSWGFPYFISTQVIQKSIVYSAYFSEKFCEKPPPPKIQDRLSGLQSYLL